MDHIQDAVPIQRGDANPPARMPVLCQFLGFGFGGDRIFIYGYNSCGLFCGWTCVAQIIELFSFNVQHSGG
uniref:Uncharacterized protein n=1 Tax=viral metagenome TaxID=1070528 RepID=A0A6M3J6D1_9ZZZZ